VRDVVVQYVPGCPNVSVVLEHLKDAGADQGAIRLHEFSEEGPIPIGFAGSPTVLIDGVNPLGPADPETGASCTLRIPSVELLKEVLN
jgi:hypothetical protein